MESKAWVKVTKYIKLDSIESGTMIDPGDGYKQIDSR